MILRLTLAIFALAVIAAWLGLLYTSARLNSTPTTVGAAVLGVVATLVAQAELPEPGPEVTEAREASEAKPRQECAGVIVRPGHPPVSVRWRLDGDVVHEHMEATS